jgi:hypothetical protein
MDDGGREPSTERISMLLTLTRIALGIWRNVPPSLHSTGDNISLLKVLAGFEYDTGKDENSMVIRGWPVEMGTALSHLRELSREWASRWGLTPVRQWGGRVTALGGGPMPEHPFLAREDEVTLLVNIEQVLNSALCLVAVQEGLPPRLKLLVLPDREIPEAEAVACTQDQVARVIGQSARGGLVARLEEQGELTAKRVGRRLFHVTMRDSALHEKLRMLVAREAEARSPKPKKSARRRRGGARRWKEME